MSSQGETQVTKSQVKIWLTVLDTIQPTASNTTKSKQHILIFEFHSLTSEQNHFEKSSPGRIQDCLIISTRSKHISNYEVVSDSLL